MTTPDSKSPRFGEWQPIESAPKDGTLIMLANALDIVVGWCQLYKKTDYGVTQLWMIKNTSLSFHPTHWMPLPNPPKEKSDG